jgi:hypothetical protein
MKTLDQAYKTPGIYCCVLSWGVVLIEIDDNHVAHQINPHTLERDGELIRSEWSNPDHLALCGPFIRKE